MANNERLGRLMLILHKVKQEGRAFDMQYWGASAARRGLWRCGSVCCAFGWASLDPGFQAQGLRMVGYDDDNQQIRIVKSFDDLAFTSTIMFQGDISYSAAAAFFGMSEEQAEHVFGYSHYGIAAANIRPHHVIARIESMFPEAGAIGRALIAADEAEPVGVVPKVEMVR